jgi:hypothetical protein
VTFLDFLAFAILWWTTAATLAGSDHVEDWQDVIATLALIVLCVSSFVGMVAVAKGFPAIAFWWTRGVIHSAALIALFGYDLRFGVVRHARMAYRGVVSYLTWGRCA